MFNWLNNIFRNPSKDKQTDIHNAKLTPGSVFVLALLIAMLKVLPRRTFASWWDQIVKLFNSCKSFIAQHIDIEVWKWLPLELMILAIYGIMAFFCIFWIWIIFSTLYYWAWPFLAWTFLSGVLGVFLFFIVTQFVSAVVPVPTLPSKTIVLLWVLAVVLSMPALAGVIVLGGGRNIGRMGAVILMIGSILFTATLSWLAFLLPGHRQGVMYLTNTLWNESGAATHWIYKNQSWQITIDILTLTMWCLVTTVALLVICFSVNYMYYDPHLIRFLAYLGLFTFFMLLLVCSDSLVQFFFAWEGVGICSYLLIGFWSSRLQAVKSALKAVLINKIGDVFLLFALSLLWTYLGVWKFSQLGLELVGHVGVLEMHELGAKPVVSITSEVLTVTAFCFIIAAIGKSAQLGLHTWLPDAMEGPTPVSALIHAATMVTAGIFLTLRVYELLSFTPTILLIVVVVGALTAISSGLVACYQIDLKKLIAYSTCSQLGYMFFACGLTLYSAGLFHLVSHGFFKALLFLVAGAFIHLSKDEQLIFKIAYPEARRLGYLYSLALYIGLVSLSALPFFSGFYSKEPILLTSGQGFFERVWISEAVGYHIGTMASVLTALYSSILLARLLQLNPTRRRSTTAQAFIPLNTKLALGILTGMSALFGYVFEASLVERLGEYFQGGSWQVSYNTQPISLMEGEIKFFETSPSLPLLWELLPLLAVALISLTPLAFDSDVMWKKFPLYRLYKWQSGAGVSRASWGMFQWFGSTFSNKFWTDYIYNSALIKILERIYSNIFRGMDKGFLEFWIAHSGVERALVYSSSISRLHQNIIIEGFVLMTLFLLANIYFF